MNKRLLFALPLVLTLTGCALLNSSNNKDSSTSEAPSSSSSTTSQSSSSPSSEPEGGETRTFDFRATSFTAGTNVANKETEFLAYLNQDGQIVDSIEYANCYFQGTGKTGLPTSLQIGTGNYAGSMTFNFAYNVTKITFTLQGQHKWIEFSSSWTMDSDAQLDVEDHHYALGSSDTDNPPAEVTDTISISPSKKSITFSNEADHQRGFIHSLTITYIA